MSSGASKTQRESPGFGPDADRCEAEPGGAPPDGGSRYRKRVANPAIPEKSSTGLAPGVAASLSYVAWWVSGLFVFLVERESPFVKFHAAQAMVGLGTIWMLGLTLWALAFAALFTSATLFTVLLYIAYAVWLLGIAVWAVCVVRAWKGEEFELPWAGAVARRISNS